jgi:hypothetical protein
VGNVALIVSPHTLFYRLGDKFSQKDIAFDWWLSISICLWFLPLIGDCQFPFAFGFCL